MDNLAPAISPPSGIGDSKPTNQAVLDWVQEVARLTEPENIFWCDGSEKENDYLLGEAAKAGRAHQAERGKNARLLFASFESERRRAGRTIHLHLHADEGRSRPDQQLGRAGRDLHANFNGMLKGAMRGRTMFVVPYIMGPPDSPLTKVGFEITDSIYVVLSMRIMTRMGEVAVKRLGQQTERRMQSRPAFAARCESGSALHLPFSAG